MPLARERMPLARERMPLARERMPLARAPRTHVPPPLAQIPRHRRRLSRDGVAETPVHMARAAGGRALTLGQPRHCRVGHDDDSSHRDPNRGAVDRDERRHDDGDHDCSHQPPLPCDRAPTPADLPPDKPRVCHPLPLQDHRQRYRHADVAVRHRARSGGPAPPGLAVRCSAVRRSPITATTPPAGFEPATIGLEVRCSVH